jgi:hypothetical protein
LFGELHREGQLYGEDVGFCILWRDIGGKVWVDPNLSLTHTGYKAFEGNLAKHIREVAAA